MKKRQNTSISEQSNIFLSYLQERKLCPNLGLISCFEMKLAQFLSRQTDIIPIKYKKTYEN